VPFVSAQPARVDLERCDEIEVDGVECRRRPGSLGRLRRYSGLRQGDGSAGLPKQHPGQTETGDEACYGYTAHFEISSY
jgi:hypothetical protein